MVQQPSQPRSPIHSASGADGRYARDQRIVQPLMTPLAVVMLDILMQSTSEMAFTHRNHPVEAFFFDRAHEALCVRIRVRRPHGRQHDVNPGVAQESLYVRAPFPIVVTDQHAVLAQQTDAVRTNNPVLLESIDLGAIRG